MAGHVFAHIMDNVYYYRDDQKLIEIVNTFEEHIKPFCQYCLDMVQNKSIAALSVEVTRNYLKPLINLITCVKHHSFIEENEYRIAILRSFEEQEKLSDPQVQLTKVHYNENMDKTYIEILIDVNSIERIIVGPNKHQQKRGLYLKNWLERTLGAGHHIEVGCSDIPYK